MHLIALLIGLVVERLATQLFHLRRLRGLDRFIDAGFRQAARVPNWPALIPVIVIVVLLALPVFAVVFIRVLPGLKGAGPVVVDQPVTIASAALGSGVNWEVPALYPQELRDPMRFGSVTQQTQTGQGDAPGQFVVTAIVVSEENSTAVVGTEIVGVGDTVFGATVVKINKDSVEFEMDGKRWTARVQEQSTGY